MSESKLFVGNLSFEINDQDLKTVFGIVGPVKSAKVVINRKTGQSKGYGFVEFESQDLVEVAVKKFEGATLNERALTVTVAAPKAEEAEGAVKAAKAPVAEEPKKKFVPSANPKVKISPPKDPALTAAVIAQADAAPTHASEADSTQA
jgi:RNA recognition motif-containing protein